MIEALTKWGLPPLVGVVLGGVLIAVIKPYTAEGNAFLMIVGVVVVLIFWNIYKCFSSTNTTD